MLLRFLWTYYQEMVQFYSIFGSLLHIHLGISPAKGDTMHFSTVHVAILLNAYCVLGIVLAACLRSHTILYFWCLNCFLRLSSDLSFQLSLALQVSDHTMGEELQLESWPELGGTKWCFYVCKSLSFSSTSVGLHSNSACYLLLCYLVRGSCRVGNS